MLRQLPRGAANAAAVGFWASMGHAHSRAAAASRDSRSWRSRRWRRASRLERARARETIGFRLRARPAKEMPASQPASQPARKAADKRSATQWRARYQRALHFRRARRRKERRARRRDNKVGQIAGRRAVICARPTLCVSLDARCCCCKNNNNNNSAGWPSGSCRPAGYLFGPRAPPSSPT